MPNSCYRCGKSTYAWGHEQWQRFCKDSECRKIAAIIGEPELPEALLSGIEPEVLDRVMQSFGLNPDLLE